MFKNLLAVALLSFMSFHASAFFCNKRKIPAFEGKIHNFSSIPSKKLKIEISWGFSTEDEYNNCHENYPDMKIQLAADGRFKVPSFRMNIGKWKDDGAWVHVRLIDDGGKFSNTYSYSIPKDLAKLQTDFANLSFYNLKPTKMTLSHSTTGSFKEWLDSMPYNPVSITKANIYFSNAKKPKTPLEFIFTANAGAVGGTPQPLDFEFYLIDGKPMKNPTVKYEYEVQLEAGINLILASKTVEAPFNGEIPASIRNIVVSPTLSVATCKNLESAKRAATLYLINDIPSNVVYTTNGKEDYNTSFSKEKGTAKNRYEQFNDRDGYQSSYAEFSEDGFKLVNEYGRRPTETYQCSY